MTNTEIKYIRLLLELEELLQSKNDRIKNLEWKNECLTNRINDLGIALKEAENTIEELESKGAANHDNSQ